MQDAWYDFLDALELGRGFGVFGDDNLPGSKLPTKYLMYADGDPRQFIDNAYVENSNETIKLRRQLFLTELLEALKDA